MQKEREIPHYVRDDACFEKMKNAGSVGWQSSFFGAAHSHTKRKSRSLAPLGMTAPRFGVITRSEATRNLSFASPTRYESFL
jgi:hypothetical protein